MDHTPITTNKSRFQVTVNHLGAILFVVFCLSMLGGCRICADCEDLDYPAYGGAWQRTLRDSGRVGSLFDPGGARASELVSRDSPVASDELQRQRQESSDDDEENDSEDTEADDDDESMESDSDDMSSDDEPSDSDDSDLDEDELENRKLEDIELDREKELNEKSLDDIEVNIIPGQPAPPVLR